MIVILYDIVDLFQMIFLFKEFKPYIYFRFYLDYCRIWKRFLSCLLKCIQCYFLLKESWVTQEFSLMRNFLDICLLSLFFTWIPLDLFHVSSQFSVYNFWHFGVSAQPQSGDWKNHLLFLKNSFCQKLDFFLLNLHWNIYVRHQEHWTAKTITKHRLKCFDFFSGKYQNYTDTDWAENVQRIAKFLLKVCWVQILLLKNCKILLEMIKLWKIHFPKKSLIYFPIQKVLINFSQRFIRCTNFKKKA